VNSLQWGTLAVRLGALVLYASLPFWIGSTLGMAAVAAYEVFHGSDRTYALIAVGTYATPAAVTWLLARYFWRRADDLVVPPDVDPEAPNDALRHGEELLTAGLILLGAYVLVTRAWTPMGTWYLYHYNWVEFGSSDFFDDTNTNAVSDMWAAVSAFEMVAALFMVFAGRRIASRLCARDRFKTNRGSSTGRRAEA
jgi:hypothetical protein